jgi:hypothetical protein
VYLKLGGNFRNDRFKILLGGRKLEVNPFKLLKLQGVNEIKCQFQLGEKKFHKYFGRVEKYTLW